MEAIYMDTRSGAILEQRKGKIKELHCKYHTEGSKFMLWILSLELWVNNMEIQDLNLVVTHNAV